MEDLSRVWAMYVYVRCCAMLGDVVCSVWARHGRCKGDAGGGMGDAHPRNGNLPDYFTYL